MPDGTNVCIIELSNKKGGKEWELFIKDINLDCILLQRQATLINKTIGSCRYVFNWALGRQNNKDVYWYITEEMVQNGQLSQNNWKSEYFSSIQRTKRTDFFEKRNFLG